MGELMIPQNMIAERAVLAACIQSSGAVFHALEVLRGVTDFYAEEHRHIWRALVDMATNGDPADVVTLVGYLRQAKTLNEVGGITYLTSLVDSLPDAGNVAHYARLVRRAAEKRSLLDLSQRAAAMARDESTDPDDDVERLADVLIGLAAPRQDEVTDAAAGADEEVERLRAIVEGRAPSERAVMFGLPPLDARIGGLFPGEFGIVAARPGVGKTAFLSGVVLDAVLKQGLSVLWFSLEMPWRQVMRRCFAALSGIAVHRLRRCELYSEELGLLDAVRKQLRGTRLRIVDRGVMTPASMRTRARAWQVRAGLDLVVVDYLQLMEAGDRVSNRTEEVTRITRRLKALAKDLRVPVLAAAQLSRDVEKRDGASKPRLSDLRESGSQEQDADVVLFLHRAVRGDPAAVRSALAITAKLRDGAPGEDPLRYYPSVCTFATAPTEEVDRV